MRKLFFQLLLVCTHSTYSAELKNLFPSVRHHNSCFFQALRASQSCSNPSLQYTPVLGYSGLGSEFEWLMTALLYGVLHNRRLVHHQTPNIPWTYNCPEQRGWLCFLAADRCGEALSSPQVNSSTLNNRDSIILRKGRKDFMVMNTNNAWIRHAIFLYVWSGQLYNVSFAGALAMNEQRPPPGSPKDTLLRDIYSHPPARNETSLKLYQLRELVSRDCDSSTLVEEMEFLATRLLYRLNAETISAVLEINSELYPTLVSSANGRPLIEYNSLQIRLTDKWKEMSTETWQWVTNTSNIAEMVTPYMLGGETTIRHLFVASDSCDAVKELRSLLSARINVHSSCGIDATSTTRDDEEIEYRRKRFGTQRDHLGALKLFADVEMLRHGKHFFGLAESNIVRLARRLLHVGSSFHPLGPPLA